jgi:hypothetical protein
VRGVQPRIRTRARTKHPDPRRPGSHRKVRTFTGSETVIELALLLQTWKVLNPDVDTPSGVSRRAAGGTLPVVGNVNSEVSPTWPPRTMKWVFWVASAQVIGTYKRCGCGASGPA